MIADVGADVEYTHARLDITMDHLRLHLLPVAVYRQIGGHYHISLQMEIKLVAIDHHELRTICPAIPVGDRAQPWLSPVALSQKGPPQKPKRFQEYSRRLWSNVRFHRQ